MKFREVRIGQYFEGPVLLNGNIVTEKCQKLFNCVRILRLNKQVDSPSCNSEVRSFQNDKG